MPFGVWKDYKAFLFLSWLLFFDKNNLITLQRLQASSVLNWAVVLGLIISQFPPLQVTSPISMTDLLQMVGFLYEKM
jgi:hypothetical protein